MLLKMLIWQVCLQRGGCFAADTLSTDLSETRVMHVPSPETCLPSLLPCCRLPVPAPPPYFCQEMDLFQRMNAADPSRHPECSTGRPCLLEDPQLHPGPPIAGVTSKSPGPRGGFSPELQRALVVGFVGTDSDQQELPLAVV